MEQNNPSNAHDCATSEKCAAYSGAVATESQGRVRDLHILTHHWLGLSEAARDRILAIVADEIGRVPS
jgi:hypothetical protein